MRMARAILIRTIALALLWWVLTEAHPDAWPIGLVAVAAALRVSLYLQPPSGHRASPIGTLAFVAFFIWQSIKAGVQVAVLALRPATALRPQLLDVRLTLPPGLPSALLTASLGLMPGTLGVELAHGRLRLHVLDPRFGDEGDLRALEQRVARMLGVPL
jgi:multicomponent Na+:H+ antiporter subunit E